MGDGESHLLHSGDYRRWWRSAAGGDLHRLLEPLPYLGGRVDQHRQHDRSAAHMCYVMLSDGGKDVCRTDPP